MVASAGAVRNHSQSLGVLMPEERLLSTDNKSRETLQEISPEYLFTSSLNSFSSRRVQYISYICVLPFLAMFSLYIPFASSLERRGPRRVIVKKEAPLYIFTDVSYLEGLHIPSMQASDTHRHTHIHMIIMEE